MNDGAQLLNLAMGDAKAELAAVLDAWQEATARLEHTHEALSEEVRRLSDELEIKNRELARKNRLADLGQMASHVAHEVRNALVPVTLYLSLLRRRLTNDTDGLGIVTKIAEGCTAVDATVHDLLQFTADRDPRLARVEIDRLVWDVLGALEPQLAAQRITTNADVPSGLTVIADRDMVRRALLNLTLNAIDVMPDGGSLLVRANSGPEVWKLEVADTGPGLTDEALSRAFEPFFTTKSNGTGLGLAIVGRIADVHGGSVTAANRLERGAVFTLQMPHDAERKPTSIRSAA